MSLLLQSLGFFTLLFIALVLLLILVVVVFLFLVVSSLPETMEIERQAREYAEQSIRAIVSHWKASDLTLRASPRMIDSDSPAHFQVSLDQCQKILGQLIDYRETRGSVQGFPFTGKLKSLMRLFYKKEIEASEGLRLADYQVQAEFSKGVATFKIQCFKQNEEWSIVALQIIAVHPEESGEVKTTTFSFGEKTTMENLIEEKKKRLEWESRIDKK